MNYLRLLTRPLWLVALGILCLILGLIWMVSNRQAAVAKSQTILVMDQNGQDTRKEIAVLEKYVHDHMRTSVSFELTGSYDRAVEAAKAAAVPKVSGDVYSKAIAACPQKVASVQTKCIADYVASNSPKVSTPTAKLPSRTKYMRTYNAPGWTPDGAGLLLLGTLISWALAVWFVIAGKLWPAHR